MKSVIVQEPFRNFLLRKWGSSVGLFPALCFYHNRKMCQKCGGILKEFFILLRKYKGKQKNLKSRKLPGNSGKEIGYILFIPGIEIEYRETSLTEFHKEDAA